MLRRIAGAVVTTALVTAALALACWFAFAEVTGAALITFRTGSMAPTMPQGSIAVSLPIAAQEIRVGDVVTVRREGEELPVTHRVVEVRAPAEAVSAPPPPEHARELILKGDDNAENDRRPYVVEEARRVVFAVPGAGNTLTMMQTPLGLGVLTLLAGAIVTWAFWPGRPDASDERCDTSSDGPSEAPDADLGASASRTGMKGRNH